MSTIGQMKRILAGRVPTKKAIASGLVAAAVASGAAASPGFAHGRMAKLQRLADQVHAMTGNDYACTRIPSNSPAEILVTTRRAQRLAERTVRHRAARGVVIKRVSPRISLHRRYVVAEILLRGLPTDSGALRILPPVSDVLPADNPQLPLCQPVVVDVKTAAPELLAWVDRAVRRYGADRVQRTQLDQLTPSTQPAPAAGPIPFEGAPHCPETGAEAAELRMPATAQPGERITITLENTGERCLGGRWAYLWEHQRSDGTWEVVRPVPDAQPPFSMYAPTPGANPGQTASVIDTLDPTWQPGRYRITQQVDSLTLVREITLQP